MDVDPVPAAILLVKDGSGGDKLLFKYPYCTCYNEFVEKEEQEKGSFVHEGRNKLEDSPKGFTSGKNTSEGQNDNMRNGDLHSRIGVQINVHEDSNLNATEGKISDRTNKNFNDMTETSTNLRRSTQQLSGPALNDTQSEFSSDAANPFAFTDPESDPFAALDGLSSSINDQGHLTGFSDKALSNLLAVKTEMCGCRFELTVKDVRFIGYPILMDLHKKTSLQMFHLALALD
ncbi:Nitrogen permease regulator 3, partial [Trinorchestia longiramus]